MEIKKILNVNTQNENIKTILEKERDGLIIIQQFDKILGEIQNLRNETNFITLVLDVSENEIENHKLKITGIISNLDRLFISIDEVLSTNITFKDLQNEFNKLTQDLQKFNQNIFSPKIDHFQHLSKFARKVINLIIDTADRSYLLAEDKQEQMLLVNILIHLLVNLIEGVDKLRAIGVKTINKKLKNSNDAFEIQYYIESVKNYLDILTNELIEFVIITGDKEAENHFSSLKENIEYFIKLTEDELLKQDLIFIESRYYFEQGELVFKVKEKFGNLLFDDFKSSIEKEIDIVSKAVFKEKIFNASSIILVLALIFYTSHQLL